MTKMLKKFADTSQAGLLALLVMLLPMTVQAAHHEEEEGTIRAVAISMEAEVVAIDLETRAVNSARSI